MLKRLVAVACLSLAVAGLFARLSAAAFTGSTAIPSNAITVDALHNYFSVAPAGAVQPGTSTSVASGDVDSLSLDFVTVPSARTIASVFRITNVSGATRTATLSLSNVAQVSSAVFASSGSGSASLAAGASTTLTVTTSSTVAGRGTGTLRLGLSGTSWLYRDYSFHVDEAPEAPTAPAVVQKPAGRLDLTWTASTTVTKDTVAPGAPTANYTDNNNAADQIAGTAEANASITVTEVAPASASYPTTANGSGTYNVLVATVNGKNNTPISVTYSVTARD